METQNCICYWNARWCWCQSVSTSTLSSQLTHLSQSQAMKRLDTLVSLLHAMDTFVNRYLLLSRTHQR
jgi:hypothetical protein